MHQPYQHLVNSCSQYIENSHLFCYSVTPFHKQDISVKCRQVFVSEPLSPDNMSKVLDINSLCPLSGVDSDFDCFHWRTRYQGFLYSVNKNY